MLCRFDISEAVTMLLDGFIFPIFRFSLEERNFDAFFSAFSSYATIAPAHPSCSQPPLLP